MSIVESNAPSELSSNHMSDMTVSDVHPIRIPMIPFDDPIGTHPNTSKDDMRKLEIVIEKTSTVTREEARDKHVGLINCHINFTNNVDESTGHCTGTLIHPRLVITCAHFLMREESMCFGVIADKTSNADINHGLEFNIDPKSDALIVSNILQSSPFHNSGLQIGDVITKMECKRIINKQFHHVATEEKGELTAIDFQTNINSVCASQIGRAHV